MTCEVIIFFYVDFTSCAMTFFFFIVLIYILLTFHVNSLHPTETVCIKYQARFSKENMRKISHLPSADFVMGVVWVK